MKKFKAWLAARRRAAEVDRAIPSHLNFWMTDTERSMWRGGWRVGYWVCRTCGARREGYPKQYLGGGWTVPARTCECTNPTER